MSAIQNTIESEHSTRIAAAEPIPSADEAATAEKGSVWSDDDSKTAHHVPRYPASR
jgi:hypothetical protein